MKTVLIIEPNEGHYEVIPGITYYFKRLGYKIDCLMFKPQNNEDSFCLCPELKEEIKFMYMDYNLTFEENVRKLSNLKQYSLICFNSFDYYKSYESINVTTYISNSIFPKKRIIGCFHSAQTYNRLIESGEIIDFNKIFALSPSQTEYGHFTEVNSNYFRAENRLKNKNKELSLVSVGISNDRNELRVAANKHYIRFKDSINITFVGGKNKKEFAKSRIKRKIFYPIFSFLKITKYQNSAYKPFPKVNKCVEKKINMLGRIMFHEMFSLIDNSDFIVINIHNAYKDFNGQRTSGSKQLVLGFAIPPIIERKYADFYGFTNENSIIYEEGELDKAINCAYSLSNEEYIKMQKSLIKLQEKVRNYSEINLKNLIESL